jgi:hypothetical protein
VKCEDDCPVARVDRQSSGSSKFFFRVDDPLLYTSKATRKERDAGLLEIGIRNTHPTVKPIELGKWLSTLLLPPGSYAHRRILIPFAGSGSEAIGAILAGWEEAVLIENVMAHLKIAFHRVQHWTKAETEMLGGVE